MRKTSATSAKAIQAAERRAKALEMRLRWCSQAEIAAELGVGQQMVSKILRKAMKRLSDLAEKDAERLRELDAARLDKLIKSKWENAIQGDDAAFDRVLRAMAQRQDLLGLARKKPGEDAPGGGVDIELHLHAAPTSPEEEQ